WLEYLERVVTREDRVVGHDVDAGVDLTKTLGRGLHFWPAHVRGPVRDLPLQVRQVDGVEVDDPQLPHARRGEVHRDRRAEPACADAQHARVEELVLSVAPD